MDCPNFQISDFHWQCGNIHNPLFIPTFHVSITGYVFHYKPFIKDCLHWLSDEMIIFAAWHWQEMKRTWWQEVICSTVFCHQCWALWWPVVMMMDCGMMYTRTTRLCYKVLMINIIGNNYLYHGHRWTILRW